MQPRACSTWLDGSADYAAPRWRGGSRRRGASRCRSLVGETVAAPKDAGAEWAANGAAGGIAHRWHRDLAAGLVCRSPARVLDAVIELLVACSRRTAECVLDLFVAFDAAADATAMLILAGRDQFLGRDRPRGELRHQNAGNRQQRSADDRAPSDETTTHDSISLDACRRTARRNAARAYADGCEPARPPIDGRRIHESVNGPLRA